jgi:hypothetical protein
MFSGDYCMNLIKYGAFLKCIKHHFVGFNELSNGFTGKNGHSMAAIDNSDIWKVKT